MLLKALNAGLLLTMAIMVINASHDLSDKAPDVEEPTVVEVYPVDRIELRERLREIARTAGLRRDRVTALEMVIQCESGCKHTAYNAADPNGGSRGIGQFQTETFYRFAEMADLSDANIWNPLHQFRVMVFMWERGLESHWTCYRKLFG